MPAAKRTRETAKRGFYMPANSVSEKNCDIFYRLWDIRDDSILEELLTPQLEGARRRLCNIEMDPKYLRPKFRSG